MIDLLTIAGIIGIIWVILYVMNRARERKDKITWQHDKAFIDEIDKRNGN